MYTFDQNYDSASPPAIGGGSGVSITKDPKFTFAVIDKYNRTVSSKSQYGGANNLYFDIDVAYANGTIAPNGRNFETNIIGPTYTFTKEKNSTAFNGSPKREYSLVFKLKETNPASQSSGVYKIYHNPATISGVTNVLGSGTYTGKIDISLNMSGHNWYNLQKFEIYSGSNAGFTPVTGTGAGSNMLKSISVFEQKQSHILSINEGEQPVGSYYYYKILPYDSFGSGVFYTSPTSGLMVGTNEVPQIINNLTGRAVVLLDNGVYCLQTLHTGQITGASYNILDVVANISGNIVTGDFYNSNLDSSVGQRETYPFRTIKYMAQITDSSGVCSSREILITDNTLSNVSGVSGLHVAEYAVSDQDHGANIIVSGQGTGSLDYTRGTGYIYLMAQLSRPSGSYKLLRTIL
jgi:hypothetical protein